MKLQFIALDKLSVSKTNMRNGRKAPDVSDLLPTVRKRGVIQPILVRPNCAPDGFEIVAGRRRWTAACLVAAERCAGADDAEPQDNLIPCAILDEGDDADAIEASMIENMARLDADEVTQWENFTRLVKEGRAIHDIAVTFGLPELSVRRVLALGNLLPRIRAMYAAEDIDRITVRHLTLASKSQQRDWLALVDDKEQRAPTGQQLKAWLFGGQSVPVKHALFDVAATGLAVVSDLFGEDQLFADSAAFWTAQNTAIEERRAAFVAAGWTDAIVIPPSDYFASYDYERAAKRKGGCVIIDVRSSGEVVVHEGYMNRKQAARAARASGADGEEKPARPEVTAATNNYIDLHRHAAVRAVLVGQPSVALRLMVAHIIAGSHLFRVSAEPQAAHSDAIRESVENSAGEARFDEHRRAVLALLGFDADSPAVIGGGDAAGTVAIFRRLLELPDAAVMEVIAVVMGEALAAGSDVIEAVGLHLKVEMADWWQAEDALFDLVRDKEILVDFVSDVAGHVVAEGNRAEKGATLKRIVRDHLEGAGGRDKVTRWVPRWMAFPPAAYTVRGGVGSVRAHARAKAAIPESSPSETETDPPANGEGAIDDAQAANDAAPEPEEADAGAESPALAA
jgi:ParB family chromosome partitioning protein